MRCDRDGFGAWRYSALVEFGDSVLKIPECAPGRVVVSVEEFADSAAAISYMESRIPSNLRGD